ncbi:hypothetical protein GpartN1_g7506.t1 [Galdieria partita]|uniref:MoaB/Mog domain-containing protein n=1 Tax=Galdieria partita TaxID=83374 RepID=A0A9C7UUR8_9RHOD|nr:hypothetical protein GpartN1_g7506.t1 [Galdieria partita]
MNNLGVSLPIGVLTVSDRVVRGEYSDLSGPAIEQTLSLYFYDNFQFIRMAVADEKPQIEEKLRYLCDDCQCCIVFTTGGTGPSPRDVTPEATIAVCDKLLPGYGEAMRSVSRERGMVTAILSRQQAGIRNKTLIVNLPGSSRAVGECLEVVLPSVSHCVELLQGEPILHPFSTGSEQPFIHPV